MSRIAAVIVTYERKEKLRRCIEAILEQNAPEKPELIIVDNGSTDGTEEMVHELIQSSDTKTYADCIIYENLGYNSGGAGGFYFGMRKALEAGYDYLWLMDDDCIPSQTALSELLIYDEALNGNYGFLSSRVLWTDGSLHKMNIQRETLTRNVSDWDRPVIKVEMASFVSLFMRTGTAAEAGLPLREFFIWTDDWEYTRRISRKKPCYLIPSSTVIHDTAKNTAADIASADPCSLDRFRYLYRNDVYLYRREGLKGLYYESARLMYHVLKIALSDIPGSDKLNRVGIIAKGTAEGLRFFPVPDRALMSGNKYGEKMIYYTVTDYYNHDSLMNSLSKGRDDYFEVLRRMGLKCIRIPALKPRRFISAAERIKMDTRLGVEWKKQLKDLGPGDTLVIHSPCSEKFSSYAAQIEKLHERGCRIVTIVFELETFFTMDYRRFGNLKRAASVRTERRLFDVSDAIVVHNDVMKKKLEGIGIDPGKMFSVGVMDYLRDEELSDDAEGRFGKDKPVIFAGNLSAEKSSFEYQLPEGFRCNLYGSDYTGPVNEDVCYKGVFDPLELMDIMEGSFGLVWDGHSIDGCTGSYGEYLTFNNPHKIALYIASGVPVIVWSSAAMADFVRTERCGLIVDSLREVPGMIGSLSDDEYEQMRLNACRIGRDMRKGIHISTAVGAALDSIDNQGKKPESALNSGSEENALIIFTREPVAGETKTRLMKRYTAEQCAEIHECFLKDIAYGLKRIGNVDVCIAYTGGEPVKLRRIFRKEFKEGRCFEQTGDGLGARMENSFKYVFGAGYKKAVLIGTDVPEIQAEIVRDVFRMLDSKDIIMGPTSDGGYYLIGMKELHHEAFDVKLYGVGTVFEETSDHISEAGLSIGRVSSYSDIDEPEDLEELRQRLYADSEAARLCPNTRRFLADSAEISVIIPVYNESAALDSMLQQIIPYRNKAEIIFVDGGSTDDTVQKIEEAIRKIPDKKERVMLIRSEKSRGRQLNAGARASKGDILFFLHCDSVLPKDFIREIRQVMAHRSWGCFGVRFQSGNFFMLTNRLISNGRAFWRSLPFGDQGIFIDRGLFFSAGMYPEFPLMEDYEFSRRMKRKGIRPGMTHRRISSSARRYGRGTAAILRTEYMMWKLRFRYRNGTSPENLAEIYEDVR